ncbi:ABC-type Fe3+-siderophore transport system permease subunit [Arthrobacter sp. UYP6]|uniref:iron chelate uptake ABC transporter family permease subunit n=1 Tax=Arthrobacter sp. UYP6 TaxID=1756378 RepID=UPI0033931530
MTSSAAKPGTTTTTAAAARPAPRPAPRSHKVPLLLCVLILSAVALVSMAAGRYWVPPNEILRILANEATALFGAGGGDGALRRTWTDQEATVVLDVRLPRVLLAFLVGGALSLGGACLQALFRNPLVSPDIIGVTAGASFGGVLVLTLGLSGGAMVGGAFGLGWPRSPSCSCWAVSAEAAGPC